MQRAAVYLRVSTDGQTVENQRGPCEALATARGFEPLVVAETGSAVKRRPGWERVLELARSGQVRAVVVWALDRMGRGGALEALATIAELERVGCVVLCVSETWVDTTHGNPFRDVLIAMSATVAKMERARLIERTRAGLARARAGGARIGRPPTSPVLMGAAADLVAKGATVHAAARAMGVNRWSLRRHLAVRAARTDANATPGAPEATPPAGERAKPPPRPARKADRKSRG